MLMKIEVEVGLEQFPDGRWGVTRRDYPVVLWDDEEKAKESAVAIAAQIAADQVANRVRTKVKKWGVEIVSVEQEERG